MSASLRIRDMINCGIETIEKPRWRAHQANAAKNGILVFLDTKRPELQLWSEMVPGHVKEFGDWLTKERDPVIKPWTAHNYINPLRLAARHVQLYYPDEYKNIFVRRIAPKIGPTPKRFLMADQLATAIQTAKNMNEIGALVGLVFGGLAGLRMEEIVSLEAGDVQKDGLKIRRSKTDWCPPRFIPLIEPAMDFARAWSTLYASYPLKSIEAMSHRIRKVLDRCAADTGEKEYSMIDAHQATRKTFINLAQLGGAETLYVDGYVGHSPTGTFSRHYADIVPLVDDMPRLRAEKCAQMQARVCAPFESKLRGTALFA